MSRAVTRKLRLLALTHISISVWFLYVFIVVLADFVLMLQCCVRLSSVCNVCIVANCASYQKIIWRIVTRPMTSRDPERSRSSPQYAYGSLSRKRLEIDARLQMTSIGNGIWRIEWSRDGWRHMTPIGEGHDPNTLKSQYLENSWRCYLAMANY